MRALLTKRRIAAWTTTPVILAGLAVFGIAAAAEAHDAPLDTPKPVCDTASVVSATGKATLQDVPSSDNGKTSVAITATQGTASQTPSATFKPNPANGTVYTYTLSNLPANGSSVTVTATTTWPGGTDKQTAKFTLPTAQYCGQQHPKHVTVSTTFSDGQCLPNGTYQQPSMNSPTFPDTTRTQTGTVAPGNSVSVKYTPNPNDGTVVIDNHDAGVPTKTFSHTFPPNNTDCRLILSPVSPQVGDSVCVNNQPSTPTLTLGNTPSISYTVSAPSPYKPGQTVVVTATWDSTHRQPPTLPAGWVKTSDTTATFTVTFANPNCTTPPPPDYCPTVPGNQPVGSVCVPPSKPKASIHATCVTTHYGEGVARLKNKGGIVEMFRIKGAGIDRMVKLGVGRSKTVNLTGLTVGGVVKVMAHGKVLASDRVELRPACQPAPPPDTGSRNSAPV
jgi:hypothetical protein